MPTRHAEARPSEQHAASNCPRCLLLLEFSGSRFWASGVLFGVMTAAAGREGEADGALVGGRCVSAGWPDPPW